jgi:hypothetical protein
MKTPLQYFKPPPHPINNTSILVIADHRAPITDQATMLDVHVGTVLPNFCNNNHHRENLNPGFG